MPKMQKVKTEKIRTNALRTVLKILLWACLGLLCLKGAFGIMSGGSISDQREALSRYIESAKMREELALGAKSFAENFVREYYTFSGEARTDYAERLEKYLAKSVEITEPAAGTVSASVQQASAIQIEFINDKEMNVDVISSVKYNRKLEDTVETTKKELLIRVPVATDGEGRFAVDELPQIVPRMEKADITGTGRHTRAEIDPKEKERIKIILTSFLKAYYEGNESELAYFLLPEFEMKHGLAGIVSFEKITSIRAYQVPETSEYAIDLNIQIDDTTQSLLQHFFLTVVRGADNKYYIKSITTRMEE